MKDPVQGTISGINCRERRSHVRAVYSSQDASRMGTARVKQEEEADKNNNKEEEADTRLIIKRNKQTEE